MKYSKKKTYAVDLSETGIFRVSGNDSHLFINTMFSGEISNLENLFASSCGCILNTEADIVDLIIVVRSGDNEYLIMSSDHNASEVNDWLSAHAKLEGENGKVFPELSFENQSSKLATLLVFGHQAHIFAQTFENNCKDKLAYIMTNLPSDCYGICGSCGYLLFVPLSIASEIGDYIADSTDIEILSFKDYIMTIKKYGRYCTALYKDAYCKPQTVSLTQFCRKDQNYVGAKALK